MLSVFLRVSAVLCGTAVVAACTTVAPKPLPPRISLDVMRITRFEPFDTRFHIGLIAHNPNTYDVKVNDMQAMVAVNDERLLSGALAAPVTLKAAADTPLEIEVKTDFVAMATALQRITHEQRFRYEITGSATLDGGVRLPFERKGELPASDFLAPKPQ